MAEKLKKTGLRFKVSASGFSRAIFIIGVPIFALIYIVQFFNLDYKVAKILFLTDDNIKYYLSGLAIITIPFLGSLGFAQDRYFDCPYCGYKNLKMENWQCPECDYLHIVPRNIVDGCQECGEELKSAFCEKCEKEFLL